MGGVQQHNAHQIRGEAGGEDFAAESLADQLGNAARVVDMSMMLIPAVLKAKLGVSEMVNSLMLNYVVMYFIKYLLNTHLADKSKGQVQSYPFQADAAIPQLVDNGSKLSWGFIVALVFVVLTALFMSS